MRISKALSSMMLAALFCVQTAAASSASSGTPSTPLFESYTVTNEVKVQSLRQLKRGARIVGETVTISKGAEITVLQADVDVTFGDVVRIGIDDENTATPADMWVRATDLMDAGLEDSEMGIDGEDPILSEGASDMIYGESDVAAAKRAVRKKKKMTYCYRYVKQHLLQTGKVRVYLPGVSAWMAASILPKHGFRRTGHNQHNARVGEVCVYRGGGHGHGHIEIKRPQGWWYGYGYSGPITDRVPRKLVGCFVK